MNEGRSLNFADLASRAVDPVELKARVDLVTVCLAHGIDLDDVGNGRFKGLCPFHDDTRPSFDVYETPTGEQRCGCFACDFGPSHDVFDLLMAVHEWPFNRAVEEVRRFVRPDAPRRVLRPRETPPDLAAFARTSHAAALSGNVEAISRLLADRSIPVPVEFVVEECLVGITVDGSGVVIPHWRDENAVHAAKIRRPEDGWTPKATKGSRLDVFYGAWRDRGRHTVLLCEGESDYWSTSYEFRNDDLDVLSLPSGANARISEAWLDSLRGREVIVLFDGDDAGRAATTMWVDVLEEARAVVLADGTDASSTERARLRNMVNRARTPHG